MNCAKCATPRKKTGDPKLDYTPQIRLLKIGESNGEEKFACPRCRSICVKYYTTKDLAALMLLHPRTVKRWWHKLRVPPSVAGHGSHRWTERKAKLLLKRWQDYWTTRGTTPEIIKEKCAGSYEDPRQLKFRLKFHG